MQLDIYSKATFDTLNSFIIPSGVAQEVTSWECVCFLSTLIVQWITNCTVNYCTNCPATGQDLYWSWFLILKKKTKCLWISVINSTLFWKCASCRIQAVCIHCILTPSTTINKLHFGLPSLHLKNNNRNAFVSKSWCPVIVVPMGFPISHYGCILSESEACSHISFWSFIKTLHKVVWTMVPSYIHHI